MVSPKLVVGLIASLFITTVTSAPYPGQGSLWTTFSNVTIFSPTADYTSPRVLYARTVQIGNTLLATWENYSPEPPAVYFPIFKSIDGGKSWKHISNVTDQVNGWGLRYQPFLYVLPQRLGKFPAGTLFLAGNSIPTDLSETQIDLYASLDNGYTWKFVSHVAHGGAAIPDNGIPAIWEPFLMLYKDELVLYYSDQRDPAHGQKLIHTTTKDGYTWSADVEDVSYYTYTARPGMTTVTKLPNGKYAMTYEYGGGPTNSSSYQFPVYYRINENPLKFNQSEGLPIQVADGTYPNGSPYITWSPVGGANGTILVSSGSNSEIYTNKALGDVNSWVKVSTGGVPRAYTRSLRVLPDPTKLLIAGGGELPPTNNTQVRVDVISIA